jgi:hypothetical protein
MAKVLKHKPANTLDKTQAGRLRQAAFRQIPWQAVVAGVVIATFGIILLFRSFAATPADADLNGDGSVNLSDLSILLSNYGKNGGPNMGLSQRWHHNQSEFR